MLFLAVACSFGVSSVSAIDYYIDRSFVKAIGDVTTEDSPLGQLTYHAPTGSVTYYPSADWFPPDIASMSGRLIPGEMNRPIPLVGFPPIRGGFEPYYPRQDIEFAGVQVSGSNGIHVGSDGGLEYWPYTENQVLEIWGLDQRPTYYEYGNILPAGLSRAELESDLYTFPLMQLTVSVPEPSSRVLALILVFALAVAARQQSLNRVKSVGA